MLTDNDDIAVVPRYNGIDGMMVTFQFFFLSPNLS